MHTSTRRRRLTKGLAAAVAFTFAFIGVQVALAPAASATEIPDAITDVSIADTEIYWGVESFRIDVDFSVGAGIEQNGTVQGGDSFWVELDPRIRASNGTFPIYERGSSTVIIAHVTVEDGSRATFTLTDYVNDKTSTTGEAHWQSSFRDEFIPAGTYTLLFQTPSHEFSDRIAVRHIYDGGTGGAQARKFGQFTDFEETKGIWVLNLPSGPIDRAVVVDNGHDRGPLWKFDCKNAYSDLRGATQAEFECSPDAVRWVVEDIPVVAESPRLIVPFVVTDPSPFRDLVFTNVADYTIDDEKRPQLKAELRQSRGGNGSGPTVPVDPAVTQSICQGGTPTAPVITPAFNGGGVTYTMDDADYGPGDTVKVIATLSTQYKWDSTMPAGWTRESATVATYEVQLDAPDCSTPVAPIAPEVVQATCTGTSGIVTVPTVTATDTDDIHYEVIGDVVSGATVAVVATLQDTAAHRWSDNLPDGWTINADGNAERAVTLVTPPCAAAVTPLTPTVTQTACVDGTPTAPSITMGTDGDGITYRLDGDVKPGSRVTVIATLTDSDEFEWSGTLPDGWVVQSDGDATFAVDLEAGDCTSVLAITGLGGYILPAGVAGLILAIGGVVLMAIRSRKRHKVITES